MRLSEAIALKIKFAGQLSSESAIKNSGEEYDGVTLITRLLIAPLYRVPKVFMSTFCFDATNEGALLIHVLR